MRAMMRNVHRVAWAAGEYKFCPTPGIPTVVDLGYQNSLRVWAFYQLS